MTTLDTIGTLIAIIVPVLSVGVAIYKLRDTALVQYWTSIADRAAGADAWMARALEAESKEEHLLRELEDERELRIDVCRAIVEIEREPHRAQEITQDVLEASFARRLRKGLPAPEGLAALDSDVTDTGGSDEDSARR